MQANRPSSARLTEIESSLLILVRFTHTSGAGEKVLDSSSFVVGRDPVCEIAIHEATVSRQHLRIQFDGKNITVEDLGSSNGTTYRGVRLAKGESIAYEVGEKIKLGLSETYIWFEAIPAEESVVNTDSDGETDFYKVPVKEGTEPEAEVLSFADSDEVTPPPTPMTTTKAKTLAKAPEASVAQRENILAVAAEEAEVALAKASEEAYKILERTRSTAEMIRKTAEEESRIIRDRKDKELAAAIKAAEERAARIVEIAEKKKTEILNSADVVLSEATRDAEERIQQAKRLFSRVEVEAEAEKRKILANSRLEVSHLDDEKADLQKAIVQLKGEQVEAQREFEDVAKMIQNARAELERSRAENAEKLRVNTEMHATITQLSENVLALESQQADHLEKLAELQRQGENAARKAKEHGEEVVKAYEKTLNAKLEKESQIIEERRLELSKELAAKEEAIKKAFTARTTQISKSLTKFLQIYHVENKTFDFKNLTESQIRGFEEKLREALLVETKTTTEADTQVVAGKMKWTKKTKMYAAAAVGFCALVIVPLVQVISPTDGADRYIASLKTDRNRRYAPEKADYVFENFSTNAMYSRNFIDTWLSDSHQRQWSKKLQNHFYKKYRISEEVMIQVASKEAALVESFKKQIPEIHPDFFKVQFAKMEKDEQVMNSEIRRLMMSEAAYQEYKQMVFSFYSENKDK